MTTPEQLFADLLAAEPGRPFVTYYDESHGQRTELSVRSLANWVAKTHHLLATELGLGPGDRALLLLPAHWISLAPLLGALTAGLELTTDPELADVAFVDASTAAAAAGVPDRYAIAADAAAGFRGTEPAGVADYVLAVRPQADAWGGVRFPATGADACLPGRTRAEVVDRARTRAAELGLSTGARVLSTRDWTGPDDWIDTVLAPLAVAGSLVLVRGADDPGVLERRAAQERATVRIA
jgi:uncharacterized protein (TIGR03089 family)